MVSLIKWPGGKRWLAPFLCSEIKESLRCVYIEPFLGGASVFLKTEPASAILSDTNVNLVNFLNTLRLEPTGVVRGLRRLSNSKVCYEKVRLSKPRTSVGHAVKFFYLNRTCWGGVQRYNSNGVFNTPFGNSGRPICDYEKLISFASFFKGAKISCCDFEKTISAATAGDVIYADPPYVTQGSNPGFNRYGEAPFRWSDQVRLANACKSAASRGAFVIVSNVNATEIISLYSGWWMLHVYRNSSVSHKKHGRGQVCEVVLFSEKPKTIKGCRWLK